MKVLLLALLLAGCASAQDRVLESLAVVAQVEAATLPSFVVWDRQHQLDIVAKHKATGDVSGGQAELADYRRKRDAVVGTLAALEQAAATGKTSDVTVLMQQLYALLRALGFNPGGLS